MKRKTRKNSIVACAVVGVMMAGLAQGATTLRYIGSGNYDDLYDGVTVMNGWPPGGSGPGGLPGTNDLIRFNYGNNVVTLTNVAPDVFRLQAGVDESGQLVIESGGKLNLMGNNGNQIGNNPSAAVIGQVTVKTNGEFDSNWYLEVGASATGILLVDGGTVNLSHHLWVGSHTTGVGTIILTNGGVFNMLGVNGNGMLGIGTINASTASGGSGTILVTAGSVLNLYNIDGQGRSIQPGSVLDISGSGVVTFPGDKTSVLTNYYTSTGKITAYGGTGSVVVDYNVSTPGKTTLKAVGGYVAPTGVVWDPTNNPSSTGLWSEGANWTGGYKPASITAVVFNQVGATPCVVNDSASASSIVMGTNGPGSTLIITNTGVLTCSAANPTIIGYDSNAVMVVANGASVTLGDQFDIGLYSGADGTLIMNGGTVSVGGFFYLGLHGGKGTAQIKAGTLNLAQWDDYGAIQGESLLDITGTGVVVINNDHSDYINGYIANGQITNSSGTGTLLVDFNKINTGKTTIYPSTLYLPPAQAVWNPGVNPASTGMWNESANWDIAMVPGNTTVVTFNTPGAMPCTISNAASAGYINMGPGTGPGGTLIVTNGGHLTTGTYNWSAIGYGNTATLIVENGGSASFGNHLWVGFDPGSDGALIMNGGTVSVGGMFGLGWNGGSATAQINGGTLNLAQLHPTDSIKGTNVLNLTGTGTVVITGNQLTVVSNYIRAGKITAYGGPAVAFSYNSGANTTTLQVAPPRQAITGSTFSGGTVTLTYQTTPGHLYHVEGTASLSPASWTAVAGSTTTATGTSITFSFPTTADHMFYRVVSP